MKQRNFTKRIRLKRSLCPIWLFTRGRIDALKNIRQSKRQWNSIPEEQKNLFVELALDYPEESPRILATRIVDEQGVFILESSVYRILKAKGLMQESEHRFLSA